MDLDRSMITLLENSFAFEMLSDMLRTTLTLTKRFDEAISPEQATRNDAALLGILRTAPVALRTHVAGRLAEIPSGPGQSVSDLALDLDANVAAPVLRRSALVADTDLITVARTRSQDHLAVVAERRNIVAPVTDAIVARGSWRVLRILTANKSACLSRRGLRRLCTLAPCDNHITASLMTRADVPPATRSRLRLHFEAMALARLSASRRPLISLDSEQEQTSATQRTQCPALTPERLREAVQRVEDLASSRPVTSLEVLRYLAHGGLAEALVVIARLADQEPGVLTQHLQDSEHVGHVPILTMRAINLDWRTVEAIAAALDEATTPSQNRRFHSLARHRDAYRRLTADHAKDALARLRSVPSFTVIEGGRNRAKLIAPKPLRANRSGG